ncbi:MAG: FMN-binding protein [Bacteroidia bacterium]|nr:FMN-binding protein [Methylotenera sp.]
MNKFQKLVFVMLAVLPLTSQATIHVSLEEMQEIMFPNQKLVLVPVVLSDATREKMKEASTVREPFKADRVWRNDKGEWFVLDEVVGKHEMIKYAVAINVDGSVKQVRVMDYVESYGYEVAENKWLQQFVGKTGSSTIKLNKDIDNISGATLSSKHISDGVKRVMTLYSLVLKQYK